LYTGLSLVAGCAVGLGFPPFDLWWLVPVGVGVFVAMAATSTAPVGLLRGYVFGLGFNAVAFHWVAVLGWPVLAVFVVWLACWYALVGLVVAWTRSTPVWGMAGLATWMAIEWCGARWPFGGFGWGRLAYTAAGTPLDGWFPLISVTGVSALVVASGFVIGWAIRRWMATGTLRSLLPAPVVVGAVLLMVCGGGGALARSYDPPDDGRSVTVGVIQGNVPGAGIDALGPEYTVENNHLAETIIMAAKVRTGQADQPDFVVWPENSTATDPYTNARTGVIISVALDMARAPLFLGAITMGPGAGERQTVGLWWTTTGVEASYEKRNLVPFGEWVPYRSVLTRLVPELAYVGAQSVPGTRPGVLDVTVQGRPLRVGDLICFEVAYDSTVDDMLVGDDLTGGGAQVVVVQTSNAMFTGSDQMAQQDQITRTRAMEARREILVATTNSLAGLIDSHGRVVYQARLRTSDSQVFTVPVRGTLTPAVAYRTWFDLASVLVPLLGCGIGAVWWKRAGTPTRGGVAPGDRKGLAGP